MSPLGHRIMAAKRMRAGNRMKFWRLTIYINALVTSPTPDNHKGAK